MSKIETSRFDPRDTTGYELASYEERSGETTTGLKIFVKVGRDLTDKDLSSIRQSAREMFRSLETQTALLDPQTKRTADFITKKFRECFEAAGFPVIFMEKIPNEYHGKDLACAASSPWFLITTPIGHIKVGWRSSVMVIDWEKTTCEMPAETLFNCENTTKYGRLIHAHNYERFVDYLKAIRAATPGEVNGE